MGNVNYQLLESTTSGINAVKCDHLLAYDTTKGHHVYYDESQTLTHLLEASSANALVNIMASITTADDGYIGLGAAKGRISFEDETPDTVTVRDADLVVATNRILIGTSLELVGDAYSKINIAGAGYYIGQTIACFSDTVSHSGYLDFYKSNSDTLGVKARTLANSILGGINFYGVNNAATKAYGQAASIAVKQMSDSGSVYVPSDIIFSVGTDAAPIAEAMRITSAKSLTLASGSIITMPDDGWLGLGAAKGRISFEDETPDTVTVRDADLIIKNGAVGTTNSFYNENENGGALQYAINLYYFKATDDNGSTFYDKLAGQIGCHKRGDFWGATGPADQNSYLLFRAAGNGDLNYIVAMEGLTKQTSFYGNALVQGPDGFNAEAETAYVYMGDTNSYIKALAFDVEGNIGAALHVMGEHGVKVFVAGSATEAIDLDTTGVLNILGGVLKAGDKTTGTDTAGTDLCLTPGLSTGTGIANTIMRRGGRALSTGSGVNSAVDGIILTGRKALTDNGVIPLFEIALPASGDTCGGMISYRIHAWDGTDFQSHCGIMNWAAGRKVNTVTSAFGHASGVGGLETEKESSGTLTDTFSITDGAGKITVNVQANTSLTPTSMYITYTLTNDSEMAVTIL